MTCDLSHDMRPITPHLSGSHTDVTYVTCQLAMQMSYFTCHLVMHHLSYVPTCRLSDLTEVQRLRGLFIWDASLVSANRQLRAHRCHLSYHTSPFTPITDHLPVTYRCHYVASLQSSTPASGCDLLLPVRWCSRRRTP